MRNSISIPSRVVVLYLGLMIPPALGQFDSGSDGSFGPLNVPRGEVRTLPLPPDGVLHTTTVDIQGHLEFTSNAANTPVYLLASGPVVIATNGLIIVSGKGSPLNPQIPVGGQPGPGGYAGGHGAMAGEPDGGVGYGPGAGDLGSDAGYGPGSDNSYGSPLLIPLVGGSGGGGGPEGGGGGGGGAILIASNERISLGNPNGSIYAFGGSGSVQAGVSSGNGSGGAIRLVAPVVESTRSTFLGRDLLVHGGQGNNVLGGRVRIDSISKFEVGTIVASPPTAVSVGGNMIVFPLNTPKLEVIEAAGTVIDPESNTPVTVLLAGEAPSRQSIRVRATTFRQTARVAVVLTPEFGERLTYDLDIPVAANGTGEAAIQVDFPANQLTRVDVWTR